MIFVTVGTHEQQFDRLIKAVDELKRDGVITENVFMQTGFCNYKPKYCEWKKLIPYSEMLNKVREARIIITHGGPASFIMPLQEHKIPIVVPRQALFNEHINNHQVDFTKFIEKKQKNIIGVYDINDLEGILVNYNEKICILNKNLSFNNDEFNKQLEMIIDELYMGEN